MAGYDRDEIPMLSDTHLQISDENRNSRFQAFVSRTRSASMSNYMESYENTINLVGHTGPLRNVRRVPLVQMSGPLYTSRKPEIPYLPNQGLGVNKLVEPKIEKFGSFNEPDPNDWSDNSSGGKNERLLRSGQLGMCNDPYCTVCPTHYNVNACATRKQKAFGYL